MASIRPTSRPQSRRIAVIPGDGIGPEITEATLAVLDAANARYKLGLEWQTLELGRHGEVPYVAMEYVDGIDLLGLLRALARTHRRLEPTLAAWIEEWAQRWPNYAAPEGTAKGGQNQMDPLILTRD